MYENSLPHIITSSFSNIIWQIIGGNDRYLFDLTIHYYLNGITKYIYDNDNNILSYTSRLNMFENSEYYGISKQLCHLWITLIKIISNELFALGFYCLLCN